MKVFWRIATLDDVEILDDLINQAYKAEGKWKKNPKRTSIAELSKLIPLQHTDHSQECDQLFICLIAEKDQDLTMYSEKIQSSRIVGHVRVELKGSVAWFGMYAVWPEMQGKGLGKSLLNSLVEAVSQHQLAHPSHPKVTTIEACFASENDYLFPIYEKLGFIKTGHSEPIPAYFGELNAGFEHTTLVYISRPFKTF